MTIGQRNAHWVSGVRQKQVEKKRHTVEVQKRIKSIARILHLPSVIQSEFYEATRIHFVHKENKNNDFYNDFFYNNYSPLCVSSSV